MTRRMTLLVLTCAVGLLAAGVAQGGGFNIYEAGARGTALGGAFTATADDASAIFFNPAGLAWQTGHGLDLNLMPILPGSEFTGANIGGNSIGDGTTNEQTFLIPGLYYRGTAGKLSYGIGVEAPFGLGVEWKEPETWPGRYTSYDVDLATIYVTPVVAWKAGENLSLSVGADIGYTTLELNKMTAMPFGADQTYYDVLDAKIDASSKVNVTPVLGLMFRPNDKISFGAMYHHEKAMEFRGQTMELTNIAPTPFAPTIDGVIAGFGGAVQEADADINLPHIMAFGVAYQLSPKARIEFDAVHFGWDTFEQIFLDFEQDALDQLIEEAYENVWQYRAGLDLKLNNRMNAMFGYVYDKSPQPVESMNPMLPDADRHDFSFGLSYALSETMTLTGTYMSVNFKERSNVENGLQNSFDPLTNPAGTYDSIANIFGLGLSMNF